MKAIGWGVGVLIVFCAMGLFWNHEFRLGPGDRFGFYLWAGWGLVAGLLTAGIVASA